MKVGDVLIAQNTCEFPDGTIEGEEYKLSAVRVNLYGNTEFKIINSNNKEVLPIMTGFKLK